MRRRATLLVLTGAGALGVSACGHAPVEPFPTVADALHAVESLDDARYRSVGAMSLAQMLNHVAQSIEYSLRGFPRLKSALFRGTLGAAALAVFDARGAMTHSLVEPIPDAPALAGDAPLAPAVHRCAAALRDFDAHRGPLAPHFAYGELAKAEYTRAHLMHLANHWSEVRRT